MNIGIEPSDITSFSKLCLTNELIDEKLEGMIQINSLSSQIPGQSGYKALIPEHLEIWRATRDEYNAEGRSPVHVGLVHVVHESNHSLMRAFVIQDPFFTVAEEAKPVGMVSGLTGRIVESPLSVDLCLE